MRHYLLVEIRVGRDGEVPSIADWGAYRRIRDQIGLITDDAGSAGSGNAEVGQVIMLTDSGMKFRYPVNPLTAGEL